MIKVRIVDVKANLFGEVKLEELINTVNEIGEDRILHITAHAIGDVGRTKYTIFYRDND